MAPDKIFLQVCGSCNLDDETCENCEFAKLLEGGEVTWSEDRIYEKDEEYIRKNALLEWAEKEIEKDEYILTLDMLIDKLNSM